MTAEGAAEPPRPKRAALPAAAVPAWFALAAVGLAAVAALALPGHPAGLGLALVGTGVCASVAAAAPGRDAFATACWVAAAALAAVPVLRAAGWVVVLSLLAAFALAAVAAGGARTWREIGAALATSAGALVPGALLVLAAAARRTGGRSWRRLGPVARGAVLAAVLLAVFVPLLVTADAAFAELLDGLWSVDVVDRPVARAGAALLALAAGGGLLLVALRRRPRPAVPAARRLGRTECAMALGALDLTFAAFVAVQLTTLFGGHRHVLETAGLTYAEYARSGVFQLAVVAALTLAVVAGAAHWGGGADRLTRALTGVLCLLTLVVLASALRRLGLYEEAFGATRLRLVAHAGLLWLGAVFVLVLALGLLLRRGPLLPRALIAVSALAAVGFAAINPDARIAARNVERYETTGRLDRSYLQSLSADAAPVIARLPPELAACAAFRVRSELREPAGLAGVNLGRARARAALTPLPGC